MGLNWKEIAVIEALSGLGIILSIIAAIAVVLFIITVVIAFFIPVMEEILDRLGEYGEKFSETLFKD